MSGIEDLIEKTEEHAREVEKEHQESEFREKARYLRIHEKRLNFIMDELGDVWVELEPYIKLDSMEHYQSIFQIRAMELGLMPFTMLCTSKVHRGVDKPFEIKFYNENYQNRELGTFLVKMRNGFPEWKRAQEIEKQKAIAREEYLQVYQEWLLCKSREPKPPLNLDVLDIKQIQSQARQEVDESDDDI